MTLGIECSVLGCSNFEQFIGDTDEDLKQQATDANWMVSDDGNETRCETHAVGDFEMKPWTDQEGYPDS